MYLIIILTLIKLIYVKCFIHYPNIRINGAEYIILTLKHYNVSNIFGYIGGSNLQLFDSLYKRDINLIVNRNEQCCGHSAEAYAKSSNKLGVLITTSGPGLTNIITPLQDALSDGISLLAISGQVSSTKLGTSAFQECKATKITKPCVKKNILIKNTNQLVKYLNPMIKIAMKNRKGPVHLDICSNVFSDFVDLNKKTSLKINSIKKKCVNSNTNFNIELTNKIYEKIMKSKNPILIVGYGCSSDYINLRKFIEIYNIPTCSTLHGLGIVDYNNNLNLDMIGMHGSYYANKAIQNSDLIIGLGNRFDDRTIGKIDTFGLNAKKNFGIIHIDNSDEKLNEVKQIINPEISLKSDSSKFLSIMITNFKKKPNRNNWFNKINNYKLEYNFEPKIGINIPWIVKSLSKQINKNNKNYIITTGVGVHQMQVAQYFEFDKPKCLITSGSQGTMGVSTPFAIGCQIANPNKLVISIDGDGSFQMTSSDLMTIKELGLPIKILIMDNENLQMVTNWQDEFYNSKYSGSKLENPDFVKFAESMGIKGIYCDSINNLNDIISEIIFSDYPLLVHFKVKSEKCLPFVAPNKSLDDMILN